MNWAAALRLMAVALWSPVMPLRVAASAPELPRAETALFMGSGGCTLCHDGGNGALIDRQGHGLSITRDWCSTMMANSFRDPYWQAKVEREVEENPGLRGLIEDKCTRCHAPMAHTQAHADGVGGYTLEAARADPLAGDGVSCTLCHQIEDRSLGRPASFTGGYSIGRSRQIYGPYPDAVPMPMRRHVNYTPVHGPQVQRAEFCATCHTLYTPIVAADGQVVGDFPEQTPYLEWRNSVHPGEGRQCQDCHMPRVDEPVRIATMPPWLGGRTPFWRHAFVGGNTLLPELLHTHRKELQVTAEPHQLERTGRQTRAQLRDRTAKLSCEASVDGEKLAIRVTVQNLAGHKFPTGFPSRRAWLHLRVAEASGRTVFESGACDPRGRQRSPSPGYEPHHDVITSEAQTQIYEAVMGDAAGKPTTTLLRAASYLKDNRLPPRGFRSGAGQDTHVAIQGVPAADADFNRGPGGEGSGSDTTRYLVDLRPAKAPLHISVELLYQTLKPEFADHLFAGATPAVRRFRKYHEAGDPGPAVVQVRGQVLIF